ncbi:MAG: DUF3168 domain-containing protein [Pigmentiphaga sp.]
MQAALISLLLGDAGVIAIVGSRVHAVALPQGTGWPALVLQVIGGAPAYHMQGADRLVTSRVQIDCYGMAVGQAAALAAAVKALLGGFRATHGGVRFQGVFLESERQGFEMSSAPDKGFRISLDFMVHHS